jgi:hypothetical protein
MECAGRVTAAAQRVRQANECLRRSIVCVQSARKEKPATAQYLRPCALGNYHVQSICIQIVQCAPLC